LYKLLFTGQKISSAVKNALVSEEKIWKTWKGRGFKVNIVKIIMCGPPTGLMFFTCFEDSWPYQFGCKCFLSFFLD